MAILRISGASGISTCALGLETITIGRGRGNTVPLSDLASSSRHAQVVPNGSGWRIEDRGSLNGTFVNGERIQTAALSHGDRILIGSTEITFETKAQPEPAVQPSGSSPAFNSFLQSVLTDDNEMEGAPSQGLSQWFLIDESPEHGGAGAEQVEFRPVDSRAVTQPGPSPLSSRSDQTLPADQIARLLVPAESLAEMKLRLIQRVSEKLVRIFDPKKLMDEIMSIVIEQTGADRGILCLLDERQSLVPIAARGLSEGEQVRVSRTVLRKLLAERSGVLINSGGTAGMYQSLQEMRVHSTLCVPLWTGDDIIGLISLDSTQPERLFTQQDLELLLAVAHQAAIGIERGRMSQQVENERQVRSYLSKYLDNRIVEQIAQRGDKVDPLLPTEREITVLFSDIVSFAKMSEGLKPAELAGFIREYLTAMTEVIFAHGGTIDKYVGDAVMALFGAPMPSPDSAASAIRAAIAMRERLSDFEAPGGGHVRLRVRFGINTGPAIVGNIGSARRMEYTAIGDTVNVAARLQTFARPNEICIDEVTCAQAAGAFVVEEIGTIDVKNRAQSVVVYKVLREK